MLVIQVLLLLISLSLFLHLVGAEPFLTPKLADLWMLVALPAIVGWMYRQVALGLIYVVARLKWRAAPYVVLILWSAIMASFVFKIPTDYARDLRKNNQLWRDLVKCKTQ